MQIRKLTHGLLAGILAVTVLGACGSDAKKSDDTTSTTSPEGVIVSDAAVVQGFKDTLGLMDALVATPTTANKAGADAVDSTWLTFEGTVKTKAVQQYLDAEDALALFTKAATEKDAAGLQAATEKFRAVSVTYIAANPG
jgi:hypothetical protein